MIGGEHSEELLYTSLRMPGTENILTLGDLTQFTLNLFKCIMKLTLRQKSADSY